MMYVCLTDLPELQIQTGSNSGSNLEWTLRVGLCGSTRGSFHCMSVMLRTEEHLELI